MEFKDQRPITPSQEKLLHAMISGSDIIGYEDTLDEFGVEDLSELTRDQMNEVIEFIEGA